MPEEVLTVPRGWELDGEPQRVPVDDEDALAEAIFAATHILRYVGGVVNLAPVRVELGPGVYKTVEYLFRWNSFVPPIRDQAAPEADDAAEEPALAAE